MSPDALATVYAVAGLVWAWFIEAYDQRGRLSVVAIVHVALWPVNLLVYTALVAACCWDRPEA